MLSVLEHCQISPPNGTIFQNSFPLTFFDFQFLHFFSIQHQFFYAISHSKDHFMRHTIPSLKQSLSLTLKYYYPFAGNLVFPPNSSNPEIRYADGDSVTLIFAESSNNLNHLVGNHARNASEFHSLLPRLPPGSVSNDILVVPLAAIQVTLFPNQGFCVAFHINHVAGDGSTISNFMKAWALISKSGGNATVLKDDGLLPCYDSRALLRDPTGLELEAIFWDQAMKRNYQGPQPLIPTNKVRVTFVMNQANVQNLKKHLKIRSPSLLHISSFTVTCGYVWSCMVKARAASGKEVGHDEMEYFRFQANCRHLLTPPLPTNHFGNCLVACVASAKGRQLMGDDGFVVAAKSIGEAIRRRLQNYEEGLLKGAKNWMVELEDLRGKRVFGASSSPRFNLYDLDFGWGKCRKVEMVAIDESGTMSLSDCINEEDLEIGLSFSNTQMEAFASVFVNGLKNIDVKISKL